VAALRDARRQRHKEGRATRCRVKNAVPSRPNACIDHRPDGVIGKVRWCEVSSEALTARFRHQQRV
jgi:hypothetical protein